MITNAKGSKELFKEVVDADLCSLCGACAGSCPYLVPHKGRIVQIDSCTLSEGQCYKYCPKTYARLNDISEQIFGEYCEDGISSAKEVFIARSTDANIIEKAQYGGTVTTLLLLALAEGLIDRALLSKMSDNKVPTPFLAQKLEEIIQCAGSNYMACPVLEALNSIPQQSKNKLGIVALPCHALALAKMKIDPPQNRVNIDNVKLVIGLFCTWALSPDPLHKFLSEKLDLPRVAKFDIPPPPANRFDTYGPSGKVSFPLDQIRKYIMPGCSYCLDMTSEFADISVGSVEGIDGWNTVVVRSEDGTELIELAKAKKKLEFDRLPLKNLAHLKEAALIKKKRGLKQIVSKVGRAEVPSYLGLPQSIVDKLLFEEN